MQNLNLCNREKSDIDYSISKFPDGEVQITLGEINHKEDIRVSCRITNAEELFILMQVADVLNRHEVVWELEIFYLMGMRMDRVMDFNRPFTLKVVADTILNLGCENISLLEPHSERSYNLLNTGKDLYPESELYDKLNPQGIDVYEDYLVVYPDRGAYLRYLDRFTVVAEKVRNSKIGMIESIKITNPEMFATNDKPIMVVDDLCDAGGTFVGLAAEIRKYTDREINVFVTHMVNEKGILNLSENYDHIYFTDSYRNWKGWFDEIGKPFPENCTQINIV